MLFFEIVPAQALSPGDILVTDFDAGSNRLGVLFRVDPGTRVRTVLSDFGDPAQGPLGMDPLGVALEASGEILVTDTGGGQDGLGVLFRVDPGTGVRTVLSDFNDPGKGPLESSL